MQRATDELEASEYDLLIVGGGIFGICCAWDAVLRGLRVALIEKNDFTSGASANCFKMAHGGLRYLQHGDLPRVWSSSADQSAFLRIAPHLVRPLPIVMPTYGHGLKGKEFLFSGLLAYHTLTLGKNRGIGDRRNHIGSGRTVSAAELLDLFPGLDQAGLTGGVMFHDGQIHSPPRLGLAFLRSAMEKGLVAANHMAASQFLREGNRIVGAIATDSDTGEQFRIRAKQVLNATGGWSDFLVEDTLGAAGRSNTPFSRDACFIVDRRFDHPYALAISGQTKDPDALLSRDARHLFMVPWRNRTLIGVWHKVVQNRPEEVGLTEAEVASFIEEFNAGYPGADLCLDDVRHTNYGLVPFGENEGGSSNLSYGKRSLLIDHESHQGLSGLTTLIGVRYTVARSDAARAVDLICQKLRHSKPRPDTASIPIAGSRFQTFDRLCGDVERDLAAAGMPTNVDRARRRTRQIARSLATNYGSDYREVLTEEGATAVIADSDILRAEIVHAVKDEMALTLEDVVLRRTDLGSGGASGAALQEAAHLMSSMRGWDSNRTERELARCHGLTGLARTPSIFAGA